jgi:hypothetical protein
VCVCVCVCVCMCVCVCVCVCWYIEETQLNCYVFRQIIHVNMFYFMLVACHFFRVPTCNSKSVSNSNFAPFFFLFVAVLTVRSPYYVSRVAYVAAGAAWTWRGWVWSFLILFPQLTRCVSIVPHFQYRSTCGLSTEVVSVACVGF